MYQASYDVNAHALVLTKKGEYWFSIPVAVSVNGIVHAPTFAGEKMGNWFFAATECA